MARNFRRQRNSHPIAELNVTNLIDLGFLLLIIFMISTPLIQQEQQLPLDLPTVTKSAPKRDSNETHVTVDITAEGKYRLQGQPVTQKELGAEFTKLADQPRAPAVLIRAEKKADMEHFVWIYDQMQKNGLSKMGVVGQTKD